MAERRSSRRRQTTAGHGPSAALVKERRRFKDERRANPQDIRVDPREFEHWFFPVAWPLHPGEHGLPEDAFERPQDVQLESICGGIDDSQPVEQYDGTLGVTTALVAAHQAPVGQVQWNANLGAIYTNPGNVSGVRWGTGTLISADLFLTAGHLFDQTGGGWSRPLANGTTNVISPAEIATNMHVNFNYQVDPSGNLRTEQSFAITQLVEYRLGSHDFAIVRLAGNPGTTFGHTDVSTTDAATGDMLCIIGHPAGLPKRIEAGPCYDVHADQIGYDSIDTLGGNSGSGILRSPDGRLVGVHTNGGCDDPAIGHNHGVRITSIIASSPTLQSITSPIKVSVKKAVDDPGPHIKKVVDDPAGGIKKVMDDPVKTVASDLPKGIGDVKAAGFDVRPIDFLGLISQPGLGVSVPFALATPHHAAPFATAALRQAQEVRDYESALSTLGRQIEEVGRGLAALQEQYRAVAEEYESRNQGRS